MKEFFVFGKGFLQSLQVFFRAGSDLAKNTREIFTNKKYEFVSMKGTSFVLAMVLMVHGF